MVSKSQIKFISSLQQKKGRLKNGLFLIEGIKGIKELLNSNFELFHLYTVRDIFSAEKTKTSIITEIELKKISNLTTPQTAVGIFKIPKVENKHNEGLILALDGVRDPGNLGTIIRLCDWFGIETLICSHDTVDCYNSKVVQATMGSIARITINYVNLAEFLKSTEKSIIGSFLEGKNIYKSTLPTEGILVMGNEANGITPEIEALVDLKLHIPQYGNSQNVESLNVAMATSVFLSEFKRVKFIGM